VATVPPLRLAHESRTSVRVTLSSRPAVARTPPPESTRASPRAAAIPRASEGTQSVCPAHPKVRYPDLDLTQDAPQISDGLAQGSGMQPRFRLRHLAPLLLWSATASAAEPDWDRLDAAPTPLAALTEAATWTSNDPGIAIRLALEIAVLHAEAGEPARALSTYPFGPGGDIPRPPAAGPRAFPPDLRCEPAVPALAAQSRDAQFVFINEAHHVPQTRLLTLAVLRELRAAGFTHLAVESLREPGTVLQARGYPVAATGKYTREPVFAELLREALRLGWRVVDYEPRQHDGMEAREAGQAENLWNRTLGTDPDARVLVHAGYAHVDLVRGRLFDILPLAGRIAERAPGAVLSIDQVDLRPDPSRREHPRYRPLLARFHSTGPQVCRLGDDLWALDPTRNTVSVLLPDGGTAERPEWLALDGARRPIAAPSLCGDTLPCLIEARRLGDPPDEVAVDRCVQRDADRCVLFLRGGSYQLRGSDSLGAPMGQTTARLSGPD